jgi:hypothetical protein
MTKTWFSTLPVATAAAVAEDDSGTVIVAAAVGSVEVSVGLAPLLKSLALASLSEVSPSTAA